MNRIRLNLDHVQDTLWAVQDGKLDEINAVISAILEGNQPPFRDEYIDLGAESGERKPYQIIEIGEAFNRERVAVIPISGTIMKKANLFSYWSGGTSSQMVQLAIAKALEDCDVDMIALDVDSPGGAVDGTKTLADFIYKARGTKPIVAFSDGTIASAAYWIASACDSIHVSETSTVGSIGVRLSHYDMSKRDKENGVVRTTIFAGKYKAIADDNAPLSKEGKEYLQGIVDKTYQVFLTDVARNRGVDVDSALSMAEGRVFIGTDAVSIGLVNGIGLMDAACGRATSKGRRKSMDELEKLQAQLAEANNKTALVEAEKAKVAAELELALADVAAKAKTEGDLRREVARCSHEAKIAVLVSEGRVAPAMVEAGLTDFLMVLDTTGEGEFAGKKGSAAEWFTANFLSTKIVTLDTHEVTSDMTGKSGIAAEIQAGLEIAKIVNQDVKID